MDSTDIPQAQPEEPGAAREEGKGDTGAAPDADHMGEVVGRVRESLGLKEGQRIDRLIDRRIEGAMASAFGLKKGQSATDGISDIVARRIAEAQPGRREAKPDSNAELRQDLEDVKMVTRELTEARERAEREARDERRKSLIRDALQEFDVNPNLKGLVTRAFVQGVEADPRLAENGESLVVEAPDGEEMPFSAYLKDYFTQNKSFLNQPRFTGSGARGGGGRTAPPESFDFKKSGRDLVKAYGKAVAHDAEGALEALRKQNADKAAGLGIPGA